MARGNVEHCIANVDSMELTLSSTLSLIMSHLELQRSYYEEPQLEGKPLSKEEYVILQSDSELKLFVKAYIEKGRVMIPLRFGMVRSDSSLNSIHETGVVMENDY